MKDKLIAVTRIAATSDCNGELFANLARLVKAVSKKPGCISSQIFATTTNENEWIVIEEWRNEEFLTLHKTSPEQSEFDNATRNKASVSCVVAATIEPTTDQRDVYDPHFWIGDRLP
ncbi:hypothetical protein thsps117_40290 [Pseudomonas sp. No.117]